MSAPGTTRAVVWLGTDDGVPNLELQEFALTVTDTDTVVAVDVATICGSDRHTVLGRRVSPSPSVLGHEAVGRLVQVPEGRRSVDGQPLQAGQRVIWSVIDSCGDDDPCDRCRAGRSAKCRRLRKTGHEPVTGGWPLSGGYAGHVVLPPGVGIAVVPDAVPDGVAATAACAVATVVAAVEAATAVRRLAGSRVLVLGAGMLGICAAAMAATLGAAEVIVVDPDQQRRDVATRFGVTEVLPEANDVVADVAFELSGATSSVEAAIASLDIGGVAVLAGSVSPAGAVGVDPERVVRGWLTVRGVHNYEPAHLVAAVEFLATTQWPWQDVIAAPQPLEDLPAMLREGPSSAATILRQSVAP